MHIEPGTPTPSYLTGPFDEDPDLADNLSLFTDFDGPAGLCRVWSTGRAFWKGDEWEVDRTMWHPHSEGGWGALLLAVDEARDLASQFGHLRSTITLDVAADRLLRRGVRPEGDFVAVAAGAVWFYWPEAAPGLDPHHAAGELNRRTAA